jgi:glycolate oxidase iron-sulfur subunit
MRVLAEAPSRELWREIRDLKPLKVQDDEIAWLLSAPPVAFSGDICKLAEQLPGLRFLVDWGGGRIWLTHGLTALDPAMRAVHSLLRQGGHATLVKAPALAQLADPDLAAADRILRTCVHCGFCTATCPTYVIAGRRARQPARPHLPHQGHAGERPAADGAIVTAHVDRCLSCLSCMTTCPSGVDYMHLVDHARVHIEETYRRPLFDRVLRRVLATILPRPTLFRLALALGQIARVAGPGAFHGRLRAHVRRAARHRCRRRPRPISRASSRRRATPRARGAPAGCAQPVLSPASTPPPSVSSTASASRWWWRKGPAAAARSPSIWAASTALATARNNVDAWTREMAGEGLDAILVTASGCGTTIKDYGFMLPP